MSSQLHVRGERSLVTHWIGGCVGLRGGLHVVAERKNPCPRRKSIHGRHPHSLVIILAYKLCTNVMFLRYVRDY